MRRAVLGVAVLLGITAATLLTVRYAAKPVLGLDRTPPTVEGQEASILLDLGPEADPSTLHVDVGGEDVTHRFRMVRGGAQGRVEDLSQGTAMVRATVRDRTGELHAAERELMVAHPPAPAAEPELREAIRQILRVRRHNAEHLPPPAQLVRLAQGAIEAIGGVETSLQGGDSAEAERQTLRDLLGDMGPLLEDVKAHYERSRSRARSARGSQLEEIEESVLGAARSIRQQLERAVLGEDPEALREAREQLETIIAAPQHEDRRDPTDFVYPFRTNPPEESILERHLHEAALDGHDWYADQGGDPERLLAAPIPRPARSPLRWGNIELGGSPAHADPGDPDLAEAVGVRFIEGGPENPISRKAEELGYDPIQIYEFVRNEIEFELYGGLTRGATATLLAGAGNNADQVALFVALMRASGHPARFVVGDVMIERSRAESWLQIPSKGGVFRLVEWHAPKPTLVSTGNRAGYVFY